MGKGKSKKTHPKGKKASAAHPDVQNTELPLNGATAAVPVAETDGDESWSIDMFEIVDSEVL